MLLIKDCKQPMGSQSGERCLLPVCSDTDDLTDSNIQNHIQNVFLCLGGVSTNLTKMVCIINSDYNKTVGCSSQIDPEKELNLQVTAKGRGLSLVQVSEQKHSHLTVQKKLLCSTH